MKTNESTTNNTRVKFYILCVLILGIPAGLFIFAQTQRTQSRITYEKSLEQLKAAGEPTCMSEFIKRNFKQRDQLDFDRQDRLWDLLQDTQNWDNPKGYLSLNLEKPIELDAEQIAWLAHPTHVKDNADLITLLDEGYLNKTVLAWLVQDHEDPDSVKLEETLSCRTPNLMGSLWHTTFLTLHLSQNHLLDTVLKWRAIHQESNSLIGAMIDIAILRHLDGALAYQSWQFPSQTAPHIHISNPKQILRATMTGERLLYGPLMADRINDSFWFNAHIYYGTSAPNIWELSQIYMWGLLDCAESNKYHAKSYSILDNASPSLLQHTSLVTHTLIGSYVFDSYFETIQQLYTSNAHQRMCQISMNLSVYYHQHQSLPADSTELSKLLPESHQLLSGDRFSLSLKYQPLSPSSYVLDIDATTLPDSFDASRIRKMPSIGNTIFAVDNYYLFAEMNR